MSTLTQKNRTLPEHRSNETGAPPGTHPTLARHLIATLPSRVLNIVKLLCRTLSKALLKVSCGCCSSYCLPLLLFLRWDCPTSVQHPSSQPDSCSTLRLKNGYWTTAQRMPLLRHVCSVSRVISSLNFASFSTCASQSCFAHCYCPAVVSATLHGAIQWPVPVVHMLSISTP